MVETKDNMEDKTSSACMDLAKDRSMLDESKMSIDEERPVKGITETEEEELNNASPEMAMAQMEQDSLPSDQQTKSVGGMAVSHCSHHDKTPISAEKEDCRCDECKNSLEPVANAAVDHGEYPDKKKSPMRRLMGVFRSSESSLPRFYAAQTAASKSNIEQAALEQESPASKARKKYLKEKGLRVRFSEEISYRSPSPSKDEDEDGDKNVNAVVDVEETGRGRVHGRGKKTAEEFEISDDDHIAEYIAWTNSIKNGYGNASPGSFDIFRVQNAGTVSTAGDSSSQDSSRDCHDLGWARKLGIPPRKAVASPNPPPDYSTEQKAVARGAFSLDGADDQSDLNWAQKLGLPARKQGSTSSFESSRLQIVDAVSTAGRSFSLDGGRDPHDRRWAEKLGLRPRRQQDQYAGSHYYMVPEPDQTVNDEQPKRLDPAYLEHLEQTNEYHKAISDVHHVTQRRLEQPQPQSQPQPEPESQHMWSKHSIRSPFNFFKRDQHSKALLNAPDVVRSPIQGPIQGSSQALVQGPSQAPVQGPAQGHNQSYGTKHRHTESSLPARPGLGQETIPSPSHGVVQSPTGPSRGGSRYNERAQQQPYVNNQGPPQFVSPGSQPIDTTMRHHNAPVMGHVRSLGVIDKNLLGPEYRAPPAGFGQFPPAGGGQYPAVGFGQYSGAGPVQNPGVPVPAQFYQGPAGPAYPYQAAAPVPHYPAPAFGQYPAGPGQHRPGTAASGGLSQVPAPYQYYEAAAAAAPGAFAQSGPAQSGPAQFGPAQRHPGVAPRAFNQRGPAQRLPPPAGPAFAHSTPVQRHPSAVRPGTLKQAAPVEHYNSPGGSDALAQGTPAQWNPFAVHPNTPAQTGPAQHHASFGHGAFSQGIPPGPNPSAFAPGAYTQAGPAQRRQTPVAPGGLARAATQKALPPTPTSQHSSQSNVAAPRTSETLLPATRYDPHANQNRMSNSAHRRSLSTAPGNGTDNTQTHGHDMSTSVQANAEPHFFRPDFITMDPFNVQGHGRDVMMRDARFFVNRDRDVSLQNMVADRTVATTGQNPFSRDGNSVRPRGGTGTGNDRWAGQNLEPQEEQMIANVMRMPAQKPKRGKGE